MKKIIMALFLLMVVCGCTATKSESSSDYERYGLANKELINHYYIDEEHITRNYALANITPESSGTLVYGLFYKIEENNYKLLEKIEVSGSASDVFKFNGRNLYVINSGAEAKNVKYVLNGTKVTKEELKFQFSQGFLARSIQDVTENEIYYNVYTNDEASGNTIYVKLKCSLSTYICEIDD